MAWRLVRSLFPLGLILAATAALFLIAVPHYHPSTGPLWCAINRLAPNPYLCFGASPDIQDLADQARTTLPALIATAAANSALLAVLATAVALVPGVPFGFWLAIHAPRRMAEVLRSATTVGVALPAFFLAFLLQVAAVEAARVMSRSIVPVFGYGIDGHLLIPTLALAAAPFAYVTRLVVVGASDLNARDFVRTARAKGLGEARIIYGHIAPNMLGAIAEAALGALRLVLAGLVIVEYLVAWPGLGALLLRAIRVQDLGALLASVAVLGALFLLLERGVDVITERTGVVAG